MFLLFFSLESAACVGITPYRWIEIPNENVTYQGSDVGLLVLFYLLHQLVSEGSSSRCSKGGHECEFFAVAERHW